MSTTIPITLKIYITVPNALIESEEGAPTKRRIVEVALDPEIQENGSTAEHAIAIEQVVATAPSSEPEIITPVETPSPVKVPEEVPANQAAVVPECAPDSVTESSDEGPAVEDTLTQVPTEAVVVLSDPEAEEVKRIDLPFKKKEIFTVLDQPLQLLYVNDQDEQAPQLPWKIVETNDIRSFTTSPPRPCQCTADCDIPESCSCIAVATQATPFVYFDENRLSTTETSGVRAYLCTCVCGCKAKGCKLSFERPTFNIDDFYLKRTRISHGTQTKLEWRLGATRAYPAGAFIIEYTGGLQLYEQLNNKQFFLPIGQNERNDPCIVGPTSLAKLMPHNCTPNTIVARLNPINHDLAVSLVCIFAARDIEAGEILTVDFGDLYTFNRKIGCICESSECRKTISK